MISNKDKNILTHFDFYFVFNR